ncbi:hypothetical protein Salat_0594600 [Sesamum alatum]|uniref:Uncharacterized protein n=1 Tax=Sesamum alatum TaxID=300844 RepID=A0AAE1YQY3_9LAMI|nr:hypothetical protein Salat_0594600 [Sesamum alatum]
MNPKLFASANVVRIYSSVHHGLTQNLAVVSKVVGEMRYVFIKSSTTLILYPPILNFDVRLLTSTGFTLNGNQCSVFEWIDPPMCRRSKDVIPRLLKRLNNQEKQLKEHGKKLLVLEAREDDIMLYRLCGIVACVIILVHCALFDINARYGSTLSYFYWQRRLAKLKIRHQVFSWITSLVAVEWDPKKNMILADKYVWEQIAKAKTIDKCYVKEPEPQWSALWILFGEWPADDDDEDESVYFDRAGTCLDDEWVHAKAPPADDSYGDSSFGHDHDVVPEEPSWWAFVQEYYASNSGTDSVNTHSRTI